MSFESANRMANPNFFSLKEDGDTANVVFLAEPEVKHGDYNGKPKVGFVFPVLHDGEVKCWEVGPILLKAIQEDWENLYQRLVTITRNGRKGSRDTVYDLKPIKMPPTLAKELKALDADVIDIAVMAATGCDPNTGEVR